MTYREQIGIDAYSVDIRAKLSTYDLSNEYGIGQTPRGEKFYFDKEDYSIIKDLPWHLTHTGYMAAHVRINGKRPFILMHRLIMNPSKELWVDHIGGDETRADNRKCNLRLVNCSQNVMNHKPLRNKSGITGVRLNYKKWEVTIFINGKCVRLGSYATKEEAIQKRIEAENKYYGEYSYLNSQRERMKNAINNES